MKNHGFGERHDDVPFSVDADDEHLSDLMEIECPDGLPTSIDNPPLSIEEKYEREIMMEKVIKPMLSGIMGEEDDEP